MELDKLLGDLIIVGDDAPAPTVMPRAESHPPEEAAQVKEFLRSVHEQFGFGPVAELFENYKL